jgi:hypothetical protein
VAVFASITVVLVAALTIGTIEAAKHLGNNQPILVIGDEPTATTEASGLYRVFVDGKRGFIDNTGTIKIQPQFGEAGTFSEGLAAVSVMDDGVQKWGYIDTSGTIVVQPQFGYAEGFSEGMAAVGEVDHGGNPESCGYIDTYGALVIPMQYDGAGPFHDGLGLVYNDQRQFFIDKTGAAVLGPYNFAFGFSEGLAYVEEGDKRGLIDRNGNWITELESAWPDFSSSLSSFAPFPRSSTGFSEGLFAMSASKMSLGAADKGYLDKTGAWVIEPHFNNACDFSEGLAAVGVREDDAMKWGYIDETGAWVIQPQFEYAGNFTEGMAVVGVSENGVMKLGYIDETGSVVIPMQYWQALDFSRGIAEVVDETGADSGSPSYIDKTGKVIWQGE